MGTKSQMRSDDVPVEIEYKFLVADDSWRRDVCGDARRFRQVYLWDEVEMLPATDGRRALLSLGRVKSDRPVGIMVDRSVAQAICDLPRRAVRIRLEEGKLELTIKGPANGPVAPEWNFPVNEVVADELIQAFAEAELEKTRHPVHGTDGFLWEVDVYHGALEGLTTAEIELPSVDTTFHKPAWLGNDVTSDMRFKNERLARQGLVFDLTAAHAMP